MQDPVRVAVLIDCENISHNLAGAILAKTTKHGTDTIKRGYGDWSRPQTAGWRKALPKYTIQPLQQFGYVAGKDSSDAALIVDAMDILYSGDVDVFCVVSGDSDFTRLVTRLRESGRRVYGIGARTTHESFVNAFDRFTFTEVLAGKPVAAEPSDCSKNVGTKAAALAPVSELKAVVSSAIDASSKDDGWASLAAVGQYIVNNSPSFDSRGYGYPKLSALVRSLNYLKTKEMPAANGGTHLQIRLR